MQPLFLDFETYYDDDYSLRKITPAEYIADPRFEPLGCGFVLPDDSTRWVDGPGLRAFFATVDWKETMAISHNALFDMLILSMRYDIVPGIYGDTLAMARNWISHSSGSVSLESCANFFGLPKKWGTVNKLKGYTFEMLLTDPDLYAETVGYAVDDARKCKQIFINIMQDGFPKEELRTIDMVVRMAAQPKFELDQTLLAEHLAKIRATKAQLLADAQLEADNISSIMSDNQLAAKLLFLGVNPLPTKLSKKTGKTNFAFAKTDKDFTALLEHDEPMVQALVAARLGHKSTLEETRTERLQAIARTAPLLPVPLKYSGAHTHRFSGDWKINLQNLPRGGELRRALRAPKGKKVIAVDSSQIEARINAVLSQQWDVVDMFRRGEDLYAWFAGQIYNQEITKEEHPRERFVGKTGILSLGYGSSWPVFQNMCRIQGDVKLSDRDASDIVQLYRQLMKGITNNWQYAGQVILPQVSSGPTGEFTWGPLWIEKNAIVLPNENKLRYRDLHQEVVDEKWQWVFKRGPLMQRTYGAKVVENAVQALAFVFIMEVAMRVYDMTNGLLRPAHQVHDELIYVEDEHLADMVLQLVLQEMSVPPWWMPELPVAAEGHIGQTYFDAK